MLTSFFRGAFSVKNFNNRLNFQILRHQSTVEQPFTSSNQNESIDESSSNQDFANQEDMNNIHAKCEPTENLAAMIKENKAIEEKVKRIQKEFEVFSYFLRCF